MENALGTKRGAKALFSGKAAIDYKKQGKPLYVIVWEEGSKSGFVVKPDPNNEGEIVKAEISIQKISQYESIGSARPKELEELFQIEVPAISEPIEPVPVVDEHVLSSILTRRGQKAFREGLLQAYSRRCAITGCDAEPVLEAAHIIPHAESQSYSISNGLLLRADIHTLFDLFHLSIDPETAEVALAPQFHSSYPEIVGVHLRVPDVPEQLPSPTALKQHFLNWKRKNNG
ncbi:HNH endonuclease [Shewanella halotolerans]|uniref:HNH endonuclease n=1 Tax=Shewanella halotolerans TaxID=2864204 RepID=UPI001C65DBBA|nr:HNH endonuclease signature motif containing protein [Shewanella halotolerans]QYJ88799.1 HNH endonuclease [Shewanella halotolerans]